MPRKIGAPTILSSTLPQRQRAEVRTFASFRMAFNLPLNPGASYRKDICSPFRSTDDLAPRRPRNSNVTPCQFCSRRLPGRLAAWSATKWRQKALRYGTSRTLFRIP